MKKPSGRGADKPRKSRLTAPLPQSAVQAQQPTPAMLKRISKGKRAQFYDHVAVDQLFAVVTALTAEISVAFDRIDTLERVLSAARAVTADSIEHYQPSTAATAIRAQRREELVQRVFAVLESYATPREV